MTISNDRPVAPRSSLEPFLELIRGWHAFLRNSRPGDVSPEGWQRSAVLSILTDWAADASLPVAVRHAARGRFHGPGR
jgi:hypothetical protein